MKFYHWALGILLAAFVGLVVYLGIVARGVAKDIKRMADAEAKETPTDTFTFPSTPDEDGGGTKVTNSTFEDEKVSKERQDGLASLREKQLNRLLALRFPQAVGCSDKEFSKMVGMPESQDAILVVNEDFLPISEQCRVLDVRNVLESETFLNLSRHSEEKVYWRYGFDSGCSMLGLSVDHVRESFRKDGRIGATVAEVLAVYVQYPEVLDKFFLDAASSQVSGGRSPHLCKRDDGNVELAAALTNRGHRQWASPSFRKN